MFAIASHYCCTDRSGKVDATKLLVARIADAVFDTILSIIAVLGFSGILPIGVGIGFLVPAIITTIAIAGVSIWLQQKG